MRRKGIERKGFFGVYVLVLLLVFPNAVPAFADAAQKETVRVSAPRIVADEEMLSEQRVTWDCIWFGRYPQAEVVPEAEEYTPLDGELLREGDLIRDDVLYRALQETDAWDEQGDVVLAGEKYRRIRSRDVINGMYRESGYYQWKDADTYHYFKYQPIKWRILSVSDSKMMLLADRALDNQRYHASNTEVTWEKCTMRSWLNGYGASENKQATDYTGGNFIDTAFSQSEQQIISTAAVKNEDGMVCGTEGGADTRDKIFLLSEAEVYTAAAKPYGFTAGYGMDDEARRAASSTFAKAMGVWSSTDDDFTGNCKWWLRSPAGDGREAADVHHSGWVSRIHYYINKNDDGVRPALKLQLSSAAFSSSCFYAGTVCSEGTEKEAAFDAAVEILNVNTASSRQVKKGFTFEDKKTKAVYRVIKTGKGGEVEYAKNKRTKAGRVSVPDTVKLYGVSYKVTAIGKKAFYNNRKLRSVTVGKNVKQIRAKAFHGCTKLRYLVSEGMEG